MEALPQGGTKALARCTSRQAAVEAALRNTILPNFASHQHVFSPLSTNAKTPLQDIERTLRSFVFIYSVDQSSLPLHLYAAQRRGNPKTVRRYSRPEIDPTYSAIYGKAARTGERGACVRHRRLRKRGAIIIQTLFSVLSHQEEWTTGLLISIKILILRSSHHRRRSRRARHRGTSTPSDSHLPR